MDTSENRAKQILAKRVSALRKERGMNKLELAMSSGLNVDTIVDIEKGKKDIRFGTELKLARGLGITLSELFEGIE